MVLLDNGLAVDCYIEVELKVAEVINADLELRDILIISEPDLLRLEEQLEDLLVAVAEGMEKDSSEELAAKVAVTATKLLAEPGCGRAVPSCPFIPII